MKKRGRVWKRGVGYGLCYDRSIGKGQIRGRFMSGIDQYGYGYEYNIGDKIGWLVGTRYGCWVGYGVWAMG